MIKGEHNTRVWLNDYDAVIFRQGTFSLLTSILEVPEILDGRCKPRTWHNLSFLTDSTWTSYSHAPADSCIERAGFTQWDRCSGLSPGITLRWMVGPPPLPLLTALLLTEAQVLWESIPMGIPFPGIYIWLSPLKPFHRRQRTEPLHKSLFKSLDNDFVGITVRQWFCWDNWRPQEICIWRTILAANN